MSVRKMFGTFLILLGAGFILAAGYLVISNSRDERVSESVSQLLLAAVDDEIAAVRAVHAGHEVPPDYLLDSERDMPAVEFEDLPVIGKISIPDAHIDLPVCESWNLVDAKSAPCRYMGSVYDNTMIIAGHSYRAHFRPLWNIEAGKDVTFTDMDGNVFAYQISEVETLDEYNHDALTAGAGEDWDLTLFTCTSDSRSRVTVRCKLVENERFM